MNPPASSPPASSPPASPAPRLVLASGSPRRREMLRNLGLELIIRPVDIDESPLGDESPEPYVSRLAQAKARAATDSKREETSGDREIVLAADTIVALDGELLGKPRDAADARRMLELLSGRRHEVLTGVAVVSAAGDFHRAEVERTRVRFAELSAAEIEWYVASGEPLDKAGAYAVQGLGALFVTRLEGNYSNVVGLPLPLTYRLLGEAGFSLLARASRR